MVGVVTEVDWSFSSFTFSSSRGKAMEGGVIGGFDALPICLQGQMWDLRKTYEKLLGTPTQIHSFISWY